MPKITELTATTTTSNDDLLVLVDDPLGTPVTKKITMADLFTTITSDGSIAIKPGANATTALQLQNAAGTAILNVDTTNQITKLYGLVSTAPLGSELVTNGTFATLDFTGWTAGANWAAGTGAAVHTAGSVETLAQNLTVVSGTTYQVVFTTSGRTAGSITVTLGAVTLDVGGGVTAIVTNETFTKTMVAAATGAVAFTITPTTGFDGTIDTISVKAVTGTANPSLVLYDDDLAAAVEMRADAALTNIGLGFGALILNTTGHSNTAVGRSALYSNTTGHSNTAVGKNALTLNTTGYYSTTVGMDALYSNTTGHSNTAVGRSALYSNTTGHSNTAVGRSVLVLNTTGIGNIGIGFQSGDNISTGNYNILIGYSIDAPSDAANGQLSIGNLIFGTAIDGTGTTVSTGSVGIGDAAPDRRLHVNVSDAVTNAVTYAQRLSHITSGTAVAGFGTGIEFELEENNATNRVAAIIEALWTDAGETTNADADLVFKVMLNDTAAAEQFRIASDGGLFAQTLLQQSAAGLVVEWDSTGKEIYAETSARAFKQDIQPYGNVAGLYDLAPKRWRDKVSGRQEFGLIAEEVAEVVPDLVVYGSDGPVGVKYHKMAVLLLEEIRQLKTQVAELRERVH